MSIGIVVPGVSSSVILILLGIYNIYLDSISTLYLPVLFPLGIGVIIGGLVFLNLIKYLLDYYYTKTFYCIIGFIIERKLILHLFSMKIIRTAIAKVAIKYNI